MTKVYVGEVGLKIKVNTGVDLTNATSTLILVEKPDGTKVDWTATIEDASNGIIYYETQSGDLNQSGIYYIQAKVTFSDGDTLFGERAELIVYESSD